ncbi:hypothetical protein CYLTODRAFT_426025 [Cylindrobasidium torrendii FP15055 ss-10]|uniref:Mediator of RNA polymerase II transcription subunit 25 n=1 Tax=Cylindrobasidium torrendii FP15055 ss-10 TaxID=1314674 RepID=A0A0D7AZZ1_9AGAR|nr:hypothetical protein CYLTODRAFT_426025 [Cylindrobasidium torrendii FP15055 ss-10]
MAIPTDLQPVPIGVVILADTSLDLAAQWSQLLQLYVGPIFKRITEQSQSAKRIQLSFISYGTSERTPSPFACKRYFHEVSQVVKKMREEAWTGVGTCSTTSHGAAALDGLVAALEMFDIFIASVADSTPKCHLIHLVASTFNDAIHPTFNDDTAFDDTTWDSLSEEFKKRNIFYSSIVAGVEVPQLKKIYEASEDKVTPWFNILTPSHQLSLSGLTQTYVPPPSPVKRTAENRPSESNKRPRTSMHIETPPFVAESASVPDIKPVLPAVVPKPEPSAPPPVSAPTMPTAPAAPSRPPGSQPIPSSMPPEIEVLVRRPTDLVDNWARTEAKLKQLQQAMLAARNMGDRQTEEQAHREMLKIQPMYHRMVGIINALTSKPQFAPQKAIIEQRQREIAQGLHPLVTGGGAVAPAVPAGMPQRQPPGHARLNSGEFKGMNVPMMIGGPPNAMPMPSMAPPQGPQPQPTPETQGGPKPIWRGSLCWSGVDSTNGGKRDMQVFVAAISQSNGGQKFHVDTWPDALMLTPTQQPMVPMADLGAWAKRTSPAVAMFVPQNPQNVDKAVNDQSFRALIQLIATKKVFAVAAWTLPNGSRDPGCLLFTGPNNNSLLGAFFPETGIPEMPKVDGFPMNPQVEQELQKMTPEQRNLTLNKLMQIHQTQQRSRLMAAGGGGNTPGMPQMHNMSFNNNPGVGPPGGMGGGMFNNGGMTNSAFNGGGPGGGGPVNPASFFNNMNMSQPQFNGMNMNMMSMAQRMGMNGGMGAGMGGMNGMGGGQPGMMMGNGGQMNGQINANMLQALMQARNQQQQQQQQR